MTDLPPQLGRGHPRFQVDAGSLLGTRGPEVAVAFRIPYGELYFQHEADGFAAEFDLIILLLDGKRQVGGDLWPIRVVASDESETRSQTTFYRKIIQVPVEPGKLRAKVSVTEKDSGRSSQVEWDVVVPRYREERISLSSLWITREVDSTAVRLPPPGWVLSHRFGRPFETLQVVGQVYRKEADVPVELTWRIRAGKNKEVQKGTQTLPAATPASFVIEPNLERLWLGDYTFEVEVRSDGREATRRFLFQMDETMVSLSANMEQSLELVRLIATADEVRALEDAAPADREAAWERFWKEHDPTPGTKENEFKTEFFERVRYANEHYGVLEPGWKSDRGKTYIQYGPPDEIESRPSSLNGLAVEIWSYLRLGRRFVFVDYDGFGRYELYQPGRS